MGTVCSPTSSLAGTMKRNTLSRTREMNACSWTAAAHHHRDAKEALSRPHRAHAEQQVPSTARHTQCVYVVAECPDLIQHGILLEGQAHVGLEQ
jgi:hypothetical protein